MPKVLIVKNISREGSRIIDHILSEDQIEVDHRDLNKGDEFPSPVGYDALIVLGGPDSANDETEKMQKERARVKEALDANIPYLGICLGLQVLVKATGGKVVKNPVKEIGFIDPNGDPFTVELTEEGKKDPFFEGLPGTLRVFQLHGETVELTPQMKLLATGKFCKNQVVKVTEKAYGTQCHFEFTRDIFTRCVDEDPDLQKLNKEELIQEFDKIHNDYMQVGRTIVKNFLKIAGL